MRKMISFKIENLPEKQQRIVDDWANNQTNIQQSLTNLIMHVVAYAGNDDVMDFDLQRKLHVMFNANDTVAVNQTVTTSTQLTPEVEIQKVVKPHTKPLQDNDEVYEKATWFDEDDEK